MFLPTANKSSVVSAQNKGKRRLSPVLKMSLPIKASVFKKAKKAKPRITQPFILFVVKEQSEADDIIAIVFVENYQARAASSL